MTTAVQALRRLRALRPLSPHAALECLGQVRDSAGMLVLFQRRFPAEFASALRRRGDAEAPNAYLPVEIEFFKLVDQRLFPLDVDALMDAEERFPGPPIAVQAIEGEMELRPGLQVLRTLAFGSGSDQVVEWDTLAPIFGDDLHVKWRALERRCAALSPALHGIRQIIATAGNGTGNLWTDVTWEMLGCGYVQVDWSEESLDWLAREWARGRAMLERCIVAAEWLEESPAHVRALIGAWNESVTILEHTANDR